MSDDVCVITGGGSGIGRATAALMGERGYRIVLAGRTASSFTAQIGAMQSREEIDAMRTLGLDPIDLLVLPRLLAFSVDCTRSSQELKNLLRVFERPYPAASLNRLSVLDKLVYKVSQRSRRVAWS